MRQLVATVRHRPGLFVGTFVALFSAAMVVVWAFSLGEASSASNLPAYRLAGATVVVAGTPRVTVTSGHGATATTSTAPLTSYRRVPVALVRKLGAIPGVAVAVADQSVPLALELPGGRVVTGAGTDPVTGYSWPSAALTPFRLRSGHAPERADQVVVGAGLARASGLRLGEEVRLVGQPNAALRVVGIAAAPKGNPAGKGTVFFSASEAARLSGHPDQCDLIGVIGDPGTSASTLAARVRAALSGRQLSVVTGSGRGAVEDLSAASELSTLSAFGGGVGVPLVLISLFVVASTVALAVGERARTMALLRAVGATTGQVRRMVMAELAVLGALAGLIAYIPGTWLASLCLRGLVAHQFAPPSTHAWTSPIELVPSVLAGIVVAELSGLLAARRASRVRPATALSEASIERRSPRPLRLVLGMGAIGAGIVLSVAAIDQPDASQQLQQAQFVLLAFLGGIAFLGPYLMVVAELILRLPLRIVGGTQGRLASAEVRARSRRMAAAAVAIALPVCFAGAISVIDATQIHGSAVESSQRLAASAVVSAPGPGLDPSVLSAIRREPGVSGAAGLVPTTVYVNYLGAYSASGEAVTAGPLASLVHLDVTAGSLAHFGPGDVALSTLIGGKGGMDAHVGERVTTYLADGTPYRATVTAIFSRSLGFADVVVPADAAGGGHLGTTALSQVLVGATPGTSDTVLSHQLNSLSAHYPGLGVASRSVANAQYDKLNSQTSYANDLILVLIGLMAAIALVNTLVMATLQGREELSLLQRVGATGAQLLAKTAWQAAQASLVGILAGAGAASVAIVAVAKALTGSWTPDISWGLVALIVGLVVGLSALATLAPVTRMIARGPHG